MIRNDDVGYAETETKDTQLIESLEKHVTK